MRSRFHQLLYKLGHFLMAMLLSGLRYTFGGTICKMKYLIVASAALLTICSCSDDNRSLVNTSDLNVFYQNIDDVIDLTDGHKVECNLLQEKLLDEFQALQDRQRLDYLDQFCEKIKIHSDYLLGLQSKKEEINGVVSMVQDDIGKLEIGNDPIRVNFTIGKFDSIFHRTDSSITFFTEMLFLGLSHEMPGSSIKSDERLLTIANSVIVESPYRTIMYEYIHSMQGEEPDYLLGSSLYKGVAMFIVNMFTYEDSTFPLSSKQEYYDKVLLNFLEEVFENNYASHMWSPYPNNVNSRSGAVYAGFLVAKNIYEQSEDKDSELLGLLNINYKDKVEVCSYFQRLNLLGSDCVSKLE
jgi:hypothetical protein